MQNKKEYYECAYQLRKEIYQIMKKFGTTGRMSKKELYFDNNIKLENGIGVELMVGLPLRILTSVGILDIIDNDDILDGRRSDIVKKLETDYGIKKMQLKGILGTVYSITKLPDGTKLPEFITKK